MRSMYRFSMIAVAVGALALISAGSAFAASHEGMKGLSISGSVTSGIAMFSDESADTSDFVIMGEAIVNFVGKAGPVTGKFRLEANAGKASAASSCATLPCSDANTDYRLNNLRNQVEWAVTDAFTLTLAGSSFGFGPGVRPYGNTTVGHFTSINAGAGDFSGAADLVFLVNDQHLTADMKFGAMNAGLAFTGDAVLPGLTGGEITVVIPYFQGSFGPVDVDFYYASGSSNDDSKETEMSLAGNFKGSGFNAALQYATATRTSAGGAETDVTGMNLGVRFGPAAFHYITKEVGSGADPIVDLALGYTGAIADGASWFVGYGSRDNAGASTDTSIQFSVQAKY